MADKNKKKLTDKEKAEIAAAAAFEEIDAAVEKEAVEEAADAPDVADKTPEAAAEATSEPTEVVDPMAGSTLREGLSLPEGSETEASASEESAEDAVPEEDEAPADDRPEESPEAEEASEDEVETLEEDDSDFARADAPATGMPEGELSGEVAPVAAESTSTETVTPPVPAEEEPILGTVPAESEGRYYEADAYLESELAKFNKAYQKLLDADRNVIAGTSLLDAALTEAKNAKAKKLDRKKRKQKYDNLKIKTEALADYVGDTITKEGSTKAIADLEGFTSFVMTDIGVSPERQALATQLIEQAKADNTTANSKLAEARKILKRREILKKAIIGLGISTAAVLVVGSAGEIPDAYGHGWWFLGREAPPPSNDNQTQIEIDVDDMDVARIQAVLNSVIGNTSVKVETIKSIQVDADNNYHLILDADKKGTDCLIDINMGEQSGFENTTALVETLMDTELNKDDISTYYALNSFINDEAATANISVAIENQLGSTGTASGGVYAKASYATDRANGVYNANIDFLVFDEAGNASIMDDAITASSKSDFRSNLWDVVYQEYGGPSTNFDGEIKQDPTITNLTPAQMTFVNPTTGAAVSAGLSLDR